MEKNNAIWIIGLIISIIGILLVFLPWIQISLSSWLGSSSVNYNAFDIAFGGDFNGNTALYTMAPLAKITPLIIAILFLATTISFARKSGTGAIIGGILVIIFVVYFIAIVNPSSLSVIGITLSVSEGIGCWIAVLFSIIVIILGVLLRTNKLAAKENKDTSL